MNHRRSAVTWPLAVSAAALLPLASALSPGRTLSWRDTDQLLAPVRALVVPALRSLRLPLWNPLEGTGQPLLAQWLHGVLHPVTLASAWLHLGVDGWLLALVAVAAAGTWFAARALGASAAAAAGAAWSYALSGYVLGMTCNAQYLTGAATAPWVVAGLVAAAIHGGAWVVAAALAIASILFSGDPQAVVTSVAIGSLLAFATSGPRAYHRPVAAVLVGAGLAAVQLLPSLAYLGTSARAAGALSVENLAFWPLDPPRLVELVAPGFFVGRPSEWIAPVYQALGSPSPYPLPWAPSVFVGAAVLLLAAAAWRTRAGRVLLALALFCLVLALGRHLGTQQLLSRVPIWGAFRYTEKLVAPMTLCLALAAGLGIDAAREVRWLPRAALGAAIAFLALGLLVALAPAWVEALLSTGRGPADAPSLARQHLLEGTIHAAAGAAVLAALLHLGRDHARRLPLALAILLFAQSAAAAPFALHLGDARAHLACPPPLDADPPGARVFNVLVHNMVSPEAGLDPIDRLHQKLGRLAIPSHNVACGVGSLEGYTGFETLRAAATIWDPSTRQALSRRLSTTHVTSEPPADAGEAASLEAATRGGTPLVVSGELAVWAVPHRPWASFARASVAAGGLDAALALLRAQGFAADGPVVVEAAAAPPTAPGRIRALRWEAERVEIDAEADGDALLVVGDAWAPGWTAEIDGAAAPVFPADVLVRAIPFPAGSHRLVMRYDPPEVALGVRISLAALALAVAWAAWSWRRARRGHPAPADPDPAA